MRAKSLVLIGAALSFVGTGFHCFAFTPAQVFNHIISHHKEIALVRLSASHRDDEHDDDLRIRNEARVDVRNLLTQRAIQSFMFLLTSVRDPHSAKWIEDFLETRNQLEFHGTGAGYMDRFGGTWDAPLFAMMERPKDIVIVSAKRRGRGHGGWSKDNPYLEERFVEFEIDIDPVSLASRILAVREQIAREWVTDLDILASANDQILDSYFSKSIEERQQKDSHDKAEKTSRAFERTAVNILYNHTAFNEEASSPFRKGNFDLLCNLCTQASVHRLLHELREAGEAKEVSFAWLRDFYMDRVADFFDGDQTYGRADDFMEELLLTSPSVVYTDHDNMAGLADPMGLAERIIEIRKDVVAEWKELMKQVPLDHSSGIRKVLLEKQMHAWSSGPSEGGFE